MSTCFSIGHDWYRVGVFTKSRVTKGSMLNFINVAGTNDVRV